VTVIATSVELLSSFEVMASLKDLKALELIKSFLGRTGLLVGIVNRELGVIGVTLKDSAIWGVIIRRRRNRHIVLKFIF
jgi:hypothetical protein